MFMGFFLPQFKYLIFELGVFLACRVPREQLDVILSCSFIIGFVSPLASLRSISLCLILCVFEKDAPGRGCF